MTACQLLITGDLVLPEGVLADGWLAVRDGRIAAIGRGDPPSAERHYDARGCYVLPGIVDGQIHACSAMGYPGFGPSTAGAAAGGMTTVVDMPYDAPGPVVDRDVLAAKRAAIAEHAVTDVGLYGTVAPGAGAQGIAEMAEDGIVAIKISGFESHPTRFPRIPMGQARDVLKEAARYGLPVGLHNEDDELVRTTTAAVKEVGPDGPAAHHAARPPAAEHIATAQFLELARATGGHGHIVHCSDTRGYELAAAARGAGARATAELCLHYLIFDEGDVRRQGNRLKVNPPIRPDGCEPMWDMLARGAASFVSSDHSSWPVERKDTASILDAGAGVPGLETLLPVFYTAAVHDRGFPITTVADYLAARPADFFGLGDRKGRLAVGGDADICVLAREAGRYDAAAARDGLRWSPYDGMTLQGQVAATFLRGQQVFDGASIQVAGGTGAYLPRGPAPLRFPGL